MIIRPAALDDVPAIIALERQAASAAHWTPERYQTRVDERHVWLAESADQAEVCGFICAQVISGEWEIENIVVEERFRRRGIAGELLRALIQEARSAGGSVVLLEVRESNSAARTLYAKHGFREVGRRRAYYREPLEDAIVGALEDLRAPAGRVNMPV